mmetsp:Transcript_49376/g.155301  ORF Transcript_49376/g.155301 Transcript_49376/m.155301 type:complete len:216 (-) Transcript_49376:753-1400(-)
MEHVMCTYCLQSVHALGCSRAPTREQVCVHVAVARLSPPPLNEPWLHRPRPPLRASGPPFGRQEARPDPLAHEHAHGIVLQLQPHGLHVVHGAVHGADQVALAHAALGIGAIPPRKKPVDVDPSDEEVPAVNGGNVGKTESGVCVRQVLGQCDLHALLAQRQRWVLPWRAHADVILPQPRCTSRQHRHRLHGHRRRWHGAAHHRRNPTACGARQQ